MKISLRRRHASMVGNGAFSHEIDYIKFFFGDSKSKSFAEWVNFARWTKW